LFPKLITIGSFFLPTYGVLVALGFLAGLWVTVRLARRSGISGELITNLAVYCALGGLIGAKILMIIFDWGDPQKPPIFSVATLQAAGVWQGGLVLAILVAILYIRQNKLPFLETFDAFAPGVALGHAIGRIGCFAAGCCWGNECSLPWAVTFHNPEAAELTGVPLGKALHPSQLYEMLTELALFGFLYWRYGRPHSPGKIMGMYLVLSSIARFLIEFTRYHEQGLHFGLSLTQWISIPLALGGVALLMRPGVPSAKMSPPVAA
jgi:phosphatidylglycerol:prolipoprotein diacylglycerol transferase